MRENKVWLDFESNNIIVNGVVTPATPIEEKDIDEHICHH